jgi:hypothetical protein
MMSRYEWIHELIKAEELIEETGVIDFGSSIDPERTMIGAALTLLSQLRNEFNSAIEVFNELKHATAGKIKVYGIAKTHADFMLFRGGFKLIFSLKQPGVISIRTHFLNPALPSVASMNFLGAAVANNLTPPQFRGEEELLELKWGPFSETIWTYKDQSVKVESVVKYYLTKFIHDTANPGL